MDLRANRERLVVLNCNPLGRTARLLRPIACQSNTHSLGDPYVTAPTCSIIVNTYNRAAYLERLLAALHHLSHRDFEVIVVNGPSTDRTAAVLQRYSGSIKVLDCAETNLSLSRNLGIAGAAGDIVVFIDDDALPADPGWLTRLVKPLRDDAMGRVGAVGGGVLQRDTPHYSFKGGLTSDYALQVFREEDTLGKSVRRGRWVQGTAGGNTAFRRSALQEIGGFDEHLIYYLDESDVCFRLARAGYEIVYLDDCPVRHYPAPSSKGAPFLRNRQLVTRSDTYYCLKNGADPFPKRLLKTLWLAPQKHFVREMPKLWRSRQISTGTLVSFVPQWLSGLIDGLAIGIFTRRRNRLVATQPTDFLPFPKSPPERKLRVCLLTQAVPPDPKIGGIARYTYALAKGLHELGHEVHIVAKGEDLLRRDSLEFTIHGIPASEYSDSVLFPDRPVLNKNVAYSLAVYRKLIDLARGGIRFDVVHATNWDLEGLAPQVSRIYPLVLFLVTPLAEVVETETWQLNDDLRASIAVDRWQILHSDSVCVPSWGVLAAYEAKMGIRQADLPQLHRVQLGIVPTTEAASPKSTDGHKRLLFVGRLERRKGVHVLLDALPQIMAKHQDWECHLVGNDEVQDVNGRPLKDQFLSRHSGAPWLQRLHFHGTVDEQELHKFYQTCDLFVAPSLFESFGLIYPEAMQYSKPVIGCNVGGIPEVVEDGVDGILVPPSDADALASALDLLMSDEALRTRLGSAGSAKVRCKLNYLQTAMAMADVYRDVIAEVGEKRRRSLLACVPVDAGIFDPGEVRREGLWETREAVPGMKYLFSSRAQSRLHIDAPAGSWMALEVLRHDHSGAVEVSTDGAHSEYVDLYSSRLELIHQVRMRLPDAPSGCVHVTLRLHPERNPESHGIEAWIRNICFIHGSDPSEQ